MRGGKVVGGFTCEEGVGVAGRSAEVIRWIDESNFDQELMEKWDEIHAAFSEGREIDM